MTWVSYQYTVPVRKWGPWWTRAIRLPTRRLSMTLVFPARLRPAVWGNETSMTAEASPFHTPFARQERDDEVVFSWSAEDPPLHARYRAEWKFRNPDEEKPPMHARSPAARMRSLDIVQEGDPILGEVARPFDLPAEAEDARRVVGQLASARMGAGEAYSTLNMGAGYVVIVRADDADETLRIARSAGYEGLVAGEVVAGRRALAIRPLGVEYSDDDFQLR